MSRLDGFIERMQVQRACIDWALAELHGMPGHILELGLGNGRTYDHLRERAPERDIYVFDRRIAAHPQSTPPDSHVFLGEVADTLPQAARRLGPGAALLHTDLGGADPDANDRFARAISPLLLPLMRPGGIVVASDRLYLDGYEDLPMPPDVAGMRGYMYRAPV